MSFTLTGYNFTIGPYDYILEVQGSCISSFFGELLSTLKRAKMLISTQGWIFQSLPVHLQSLAMLF